MNPLGLKGTSFVITGGSGAIGSAGCMTWANCVEMNAAGWAIANHTDWNSGLTGISQAAAEGHLSNARTAIESNVGARASRHVAYPGGSYDATVLAAMTATGMLTGRTTADGNFRYTTVTEYEIPVMALASGSAIATIESRFYTALKQRKSTMFFLHKIGSGGGSEVTQAVFRQMIDFIVARGLTLYTIDEMYSRM